MKLKLLEIMKNKNITAYQLSKQTSIPTSMFYALEKGRQKTLSLEYAYKIAKALHIRIEDLIEGEEHDNY